MSTGTITTPLDPRMDARIVDAILVRVAAGESIPDATRAVALGAAEEAAGEQHMGTAEQLFAVTHVSRLGADLMARIRDLVRGGLVAV